MNASQPTPALTLTTTTSSFTSSIPTSRTAAPATTSSLDGLNAAANEADAAQSDAERQRREWAVAVSSGVSGRVLQALRQEWEEEEYERRIALNAAATSTSNAVVVDWEAIEAEWAQQSSSNEDSTFSTTTTNAVPAPYVMEMKRLGLMSSGNSGNSSAGSSGGVSSGGGFVHYVLSSNARFYGWISGKEQRFSRVNEAIAAHVIKCVDTPYPLPLPTPQSMHQSMQ